MIKGIIVILATFVAINSHADVYTNFGAGTSAIGSAQGVRYSTRDLLSNYYVPAGLTDWNEVKVSASLLYSIDNFKDLGNIVVDSKKYGSSSQSTGDVDTDTPDLNNLMLGVFVPSSKKKGTGLSLFTSMPVGKFLSVETQSAYYPQYSMYQSDGQRMNAAINYHSKWNDSLDYSLGVHMFFVTGSTIITRFPTSSGGQPSSSNADLKVDVKPAFAPSFSLRKKWDETTEYSLAYVGERDAKLAFNANNAINVFVSPIPIIVDGKASLYYDPDLLSVHMKKKMSSGNLNIGIELERWSQFKSSVMIMEITGGTSFEQLNIDQGFKDVVSPRIAWQSAGEDSWWTIGYAYRPSPMTRSVDESNYLDSDKQVLGTSYSRRANSIFGLVDMENKWGFALQVHRLNEKFIQKNETDSVGYPGYTIGGNVFTVGFHIEAGL